VTLYYVGDYDGQKRYIPGIPRDDLDDAAVDAAVDVLGAESPEQAREWLIRSGAWSEAAPEELASETPEDEAPARKAKAPKTD
jgi:uncharacterized protein with von Willebrand factor type A (vWA) domain